jgi:glutaryl-CoA dehydrogenase
MAVEESKAVRVDPFFVDELLSKEEREIRDRVRAFSDEEVVPIMADCWERAEFPFGLVPKVAGLGICGDTIKGYGCAGLSAVASGLVAMELTRGDGSVYTFFGAHSGFAMNSIAALGSEEQKEKWLPQMARMEKIGAFALTEPNHGSDAVLLETSARREGDEYVIDGEKRWIGNASFADVIVVWAREEEGNLGGFLVEKDAPGLQTSPITGKASKRSGVQADMKLDNIRVPAENRLPGANSFKDATRALAIVRCGVAWEALGHAVASYEAAVAYAKERKQFGKPLASYQLVQDKLAKMLGDICGMQLVCLRLSQLAEEGKMTDTMASLAKMDNARKARRIVADARDILGGNGILYEYHVARHWADMEAVYTYEGTDSINSLIVGRWITGLRAFS